MSGSHADPGIARSPGLPQRIDATAWGAFFLWVGCTLLIHISWGAALLGAGIIALGAQLARRICGLRIDRWWLVVGVLLTLFGSLRLLDLRVDVMPFLFVAAGIGLLGSTWLRRS
jgi:hypothetical protein